MAGREQPFHQGEIRTAASLRRMRPETCRRNEGTLQMRTQHVRYRAVHGHFCERLDELLLGRRDEGRLVRGHAALEERTPCPAVPVGVCREEVDPGETVHL